MMNPDNLLQALAPATSSHDTVNDPLSVYCEPELYNLSDYVDIPQLIASFKLPCSSLSATKLNILSLNAESLNAKLHHISYLIDAIESENCRLHVICLQESWISSTDDTSLLQMDNYFSLHQPKSCSSRGGLSMFIHRSLKFKNLISKSFSTWENQLVEIQPSYSTKKILICNIYRPPNSRNLTNLQALNEFNDEFLDHYCNFPPNYFIKLLVGDFNLNLLKINENENISTFLDNLTSNGFIPQITLPTRYSLQYGSSSLIDNIFVKSNHDNVFIAKILTHKISDHFGCCISSELQTTHKKPPPKFVKLPSNSLENFETFHQSFSDLNLLDEIDISINADPSKNYNILEQSIIHTQSAAFPSKRVRFNKYKHKRSKWITYGIMKSIQFRDDLHKQVRQLPPYSVEWVNLKTNLSTYKFILNKCIRTAKEDYYAKLFDSIKGDMKKTWKSINGVLNRGKNKQDLPQCFNIDGSLVSDPTLIANAFNDFFVNIGPSLAESIDTSKINYTFDAYLSNQSNSLFDFSSVTNNDVLTTIESLESKSSCGYDNLSSIMLKNIKNEISPILTTIVNQAFNSGTFPDKLKIAKVSPIYKKSDKSVIDNYRPISLLPTISKVFEKLIHTQILNYFNENKLLFKSQYGFRPKHSTEFATLELIDRLVSIMNNGDIPLSIFIDLSKAFDTLDHNILLAKLKFYGLNDKSLKLLSSYLENRFQYVIFNEVSSTRKKVLTGVPQGSILGPLLFLIYINDLQYASNLFSMISYADDTTLTYTIKPNSKNSSAKINVELVKIHNWLSLNKLSLNISKTNFMIFSRNKSVPSIDLELNGIPLQKVNDFNFLGTSIDSALCWKPHLVKIAGKISKVVCLLSRLKKFLPNYILLKIYNALIVPHMNYSILCWGFTSTKRILTFQKKALKIITGTNMRTPSAPLFKSMNLLRIDDLFLSGLLKFYFKLNAQLLPDYFNSFNISRLSHDHQTRYKRIILPPMTKNYTRACVRFGLIKLLNTVYKPTCSIDSTIYYIQTSYDKLASKPPRIISDIIDKLNTHSFAGYSNYIKVRFIQNYIIQ